MSDSLVQDCVELLQRLVSIPSFSREEGSTATEIESFLQAKGVTTHRKLNNIWAYNEHYDPALPSLLLNSHHDTVKPNSGYIKDPFSPEIENGKLFGLGSNDAGGCLVSLIGTFLHFYRRENMKYNLCIALTAEEEISGMNGIELILPELGSLEFALVGEPTLMQMAIAEKGLMVIDCIVHGKSGHAAREEGDNAIYKAIKDIEWFRNYEFAKKSALFGAVKMTVTIIESGSQHNVIPASCKFTVDVRVTDAYRNEEVLKIIRQNVSCEVFPRSTRLKSSSISVEHPIVKAGKELGLSTYGSPTTSDQALLDIPSLKIGPGDSARSHSADEFIYVAEIEQGIGIYCQLLEKIL